MIAGVGMTRFGRRPDQSLVALACEAARAALDDAGVRAEDLDALYLGTFAGRSLQRQGVLATVVAERIGARRAATTVVEGACASGGIALRHAMLACRAGAADLALCVGVEHQTAFSTEVVTRSLAEAFGRADERARGLTFPAFFALVASAHGARWGTTAEQRAAVTVKNRRFGAANPLAAFSEPVTIDDVLAARPICDPLGLLDCSPVSDGAAAALVARPDAVDDAARAVALLACEQASGPTSVAAIDDLTTFPATRRAAERAYAAAGVAPADVDVVELHDCFSIAEIVDCEDLGLLPRGEAAAAIAAGATDRGGAGPAVNPSGGLLSRGHPVGATGLAQVHELVAQLRGNAVNQVPGARIGLAHNLGGTGATATVTVVAA